ncbi:hypothetical protein BD769DRAFT_1674226 [Suillus cothurnatus]|nr:hypothetical protein BD769DRAFT_1674226 [Suillus cothurnatus]
MFGESLEEEYDGAGACYSQDGSTFLDLFDTDEYAECRVDNLYYPFTSKEEWEIANYLLRSSLSMAAIDEFLKLSMRAKLEMPDYLLHPSYQVSNPTLLEGPCGMLGEPFQQSIVSQQA